MSTFQPSEVELYFEAHTKKTNQVATSDRTLQRLKNPRMGVDELSEALKEHKKTLKHGKNHITLLMCLSSVTYSTKV